MSSSEAKGKAKAKKVGEEDDDQTDQRHSGHGSYFERPKKNRPPAGPSRKDKGKAAGEEVNQIQRNYLGPSSGGYIRKQEIGPDQRNQLVSGSGDGSYLGRTNKNRPPACPLRKDKAKAETGEEGYQSVQSLSSRDGSNLERPKKNRPPAGPSRRDKGKAEAGEEGYQIVQRNEPGPSSGGYIRKQEVGSPSKKAKFGEIYTNCGDDSDKSNQLVLGFGLSAHDVNPNNVVQYQDAHVTTIILDAIKMNHTLVARPKEIHAWDIDKRRYNSSYGIRIVSLKSFASEDKHFAMGLVHKNFSKILLYEREGSDVHMAHVWNPLSALSTYCVEAPLKQYRTSDHPSSVYRYLSDTYRTFIQEIIQSIVYLHKSDRSLGGFSIQNLIVVNDNGSHKTEFWGVLFYELNLHREKADFFSIAQVVKAIVPGWETIFLVRDLVQKAQGYSSSKDSVLIVQHLALLSATEKMGFVRNCVDKKPPCHYKWYSKYLKALKGMGSNTGWTTKYRVKPGKGPMYSCFWFGRSYKDGCTYNIVEKNESILSFSRNMSAHLKQYIDADSSVQHPNVNDEHISSTIFNEFEKQLTRFQEELHKMIFWRSFQSNIGVIWQPWFG